MDHAHERGTERSVSNEEMLRTIELGSPIRKESTVVQDFAGDFDEERVTFTHRFVSRPGLTIGVVAGISESNPNAVVVTCWATRR